MFLACKKIYFLQDGILRPFLSFNFPIINFQLFITPFLFDSFGYKHDFDAYWQIFPNFRDYTPCVFSETLSP